MKDLTKMDGKDIISMRFSYLFTLVVIYIWAAICFYKHDYQTGSNLVAIINFQWLIFFILRFYYSRKMNGKS